jgi:hypothetical protein
MSGRPAGLQIVFFIKNGAKLTDISSDPVAVRMWMAVSA